jgi:hypothetical protein
MRHTRPVLLAGFSLLAAGCAAPPPAVQQAAPAQGVSYTAQIVSVRQVSGGLALPQVMQALGQPAADPPAGAEEIVVQLPDGSVKSLVPPPGAAPASLVPGTRVVITETPQMRIVPR